jgi:cell division protein FtsN
MQTSSFSPRCAPSRLHSSLRQAAAVCSLLALTLQSASAMSIRELRALEKSDSKQGVNYKRYYLVGAMEGALQAHDQGVRAGAKPAICLNGRRLEPSAAEGLYQTELRRNQDLYEADMPVPLVLGNALATVYPC